MLETKSIIIKWQIRNKTWYINKGYLFTKIGNEFEVNVKDLSDGSNILVNIQCDGCRKELKNIIWNDYKRCAQENGEYYCQKCARNGYKKWVSFYEWCYANLPKEIADIIMLRWDFNLNIDKNGEVINPKNIGLGSEGFNRKGYWFKCLEHPEHESEQKNIASFTKGYNRSIDCNQCNSLSITHPEIVKYLANKDDAYKFSKGSNKKILTKCPECGYEKEKSIYDFVLSHFNCSRCGDGISYPEKFTFNFLEQLKSNFKTQLTKTSFDWCSNYKYDFYINNIYCVIETHGEQHYIEPNGNWDSLKKTQENDKNKEQLAKENGIKNYIVIDCRISNLEWIKTSIMKSELPTLLNFKESDIDWLKCHEISCSSLVNVACNLWKNGINNTNKIALELKIDRTTAVKYLKQGAKLDWCDYDSKKESNIKNNKKIICLTTGEIFNSIINATKQYNLKSASSISACCTNVKKYAGKHPETSEKLTWMYYDEYIINNTEVK